VSQDSGVPCQSAFQTRYSLCLSSGLPASPLPKKARLSSSLSRLLRSTLILSRTAASASTPGGGYIGCRSTYAPQGESSAMKAAEGYSNRTPASGKSSNCHSSSGVLFSAQLPNESLSTNIVSVQEDSAPNATTRISASFLRRPCRLPEIKETSTLPPRRSSHLRVYRQRTHLQSPARSGQPYSRNQRQLL